MAAVVTPDAIKAALDARAAGMKAGPRTVAELADVTGRRHLRAAYGDGAMTVAAILAGVDARQWAGVTLFHREGTNVAAPAAGSLHDGGHYPDLMGLLTGWATQQPLSAILTALWSAGGTPGTGTMSCGINSSAPTLRWASSCAR